MNHPAIKQIYPLLTDNPERDRPAPYDPRFPWVEFNAVRGWHEPEGAPAENQQLVVEWEPSQMPSWRDAPLNGFQTIAREVGAELPKENGLQHVENKLKKLDEEIRKLSAHNYIEAQRKQLSEKEIEPEKRAQLLANIAAEESALPDVIKQLNVEYRRLCIKLVPTAVKVAETMIERVADLINRHVQAIQEEAEKFGLPVPTRKEVLHKRPLLDSYSRLGNQIEGVHAELLEPTGAVRARNLLTEAGVIK